MLGGGRAILESFENGLRLLCIESFEVQTGAGFAISGEKLKRILGNQVSNFLSLSNCRLRTSPVSNALIMRPI